MDDIKKDLPMSMTMAAFTGISWWLGLEVSISLFLVFKRRRGLYFWSCALIAWGVLLQPLFIILADFRVWTDPVPSIIMIYFTWVIMVVPQSWVLYSRLHLLMGNRKVLRGIKFVLVFNSVAFTVPTMVIGILSQTTKFNPSLPRSNLIWGRTEIIVFFLQETALNILYIIQTRKFIQGRLPLRQRQRPWAPWPSVPSGSGSAHLVYASKGREKTVLWHLIYANLFIIVLDLTLLGIQCADLFYLQGAFKPCVYGIKLKIEFSVLNRLRDLILRSDDNGICLSSGRESSGLAETIGAGLRPQSTASDVPILRS
ncbi:uncharacterized protein BDV17DRAFT_296603 [Aspergillus undulatus]|uniref:uncharacterized protein n=1 Tax=Aspergillus undulatus TaxID=1810928 RepID=UPI003CCE0633